MEEKLKVLTRKQETLASELRKNNKYTKYLTDVAESSENFGEVQTIIDRWETLDGPPPPPPLRVRHRRFASGAGCRRAANGSCAAFSEMQRDLQKDAEMFITNHVEYRDKMLTLQQVRAPRFFLQRSCPPGCARAGACLASSLSPTVVWSWLLHRARTSLTLPAHPAVQDKQGEILQSNTEITEMKGELEQLQSQARFLADKAERQNSQAQRRALIIGQIKM